MTSVQPQPRAVPDTGPELARPVAVRRRVRLPLPRWRPALVRLRAAARRNPAMTALLAVGLVLRIVVTVAYRPAMLFFGDSLSYLQNAHTLTPDVFHPIGYALLLRILSVTGSLFAVVAVQHLVGLATGVLVYRLARRAGVGKTAAALASAPVLLDAYQVNVEQFVLSDSVFTLLVVGAITVATRRRLTPRSMVGAGLLLAAATLTRTVGVAVVVTVLLYWLWRRVGRRRLLAGAAAAIIPLAGYAGLYDLQYGAFGLQGMSGRFLYGEVATFVDCSPLTLPPHQASLCPGVPPKDRPGLNFYVWSPQSPYAALPGPDSNRDGIASRFARTIILHQPLDYARQVLATTAQYFAPGRVAGPRGWYDGSWQFYVDDAPPAWHALPATTGFWGHGESPSTVPALEDGLRAYQRVGYTPGPLLALGALLAAVGLVAARRRDAARRTCLLLLVTAGLMLVVPSANVGFDYRYLLPDIALLPAAGALGFTLLRGRLAARRRRSGRWVAVVAGAGVLAATATNAAYAGVYPIDGLRPGAPAPIGTAQPAGRAVQASVATPQVAGVACFSANRGHRVGTEFLLQFPVSVVGRTGARLAGPDAWSVHEGGDTWAPTVTPPWQTIPPDSVAVAREAAKASPSGGMLPTRVLHPGDRIHGLVTFWVPDTSGTIVYQDGFGGGAAAWSFSVPAPTAQCEAASTAPRPSFG